MSFISSLFSAGKSIANSLLGGSGGGLASSIGGLARDTLTNMLGSRTRKTGGFGGIMNGIGDIIGRGRQNGHFRDAMDNLINRGIDYGGNLIDRFARSRYIRDKMPIAVGYLDNAGDAFRNYSTNKYKRIMSNFDQPKDT